MARDKNVDPSEIRRFNELAGRWWDEKGEMQLLHAVNPLRLLYVDQRAPLYGKTVLDVGCGGGILTESMARMGALVTGIDAAEDLITIARTHQERLLVRTDYICTTAEAFASEHPLNFDRVTCFEMLEHVPNPQLVVRACARLAKPGSHVFFSTINRTIKAYVQAIVAGEYVFRFLPRGTHDFRKFIRHTELSAWVEENGLDILHMAGLTYNLFTQRYSLIPDINVNYILHAHKRDGTP